jgi:hypothetical protein
VEVTGDRPRIFQTWRETITMAIATAMVEIRLFRYCTGLAP